jgi:hypothetical protein
MLKQVIADLQRPPDWKRKCGVREEGHLQAKAEDVRIDQWQVGIRVQPSQLEKVGQLTPIDAMPPPTRRQFWDPLRRIEPRRRAQCSQHEGKR